MLIRYYGMYYSHKEWACKLIKYQRSQKRQREVLENNFTKQSWFDLATKKSSETKYY